MSDQFYPADDRAHCSLSLSVSACKRTLSIFNIDYDIKTWIGHSWGDFCFLPLGWYMHGQMMYDQEMLIPLLCSFGCVCVWDGEGTGSLPTQVFCCFSFHSSGISQLLWDQMVFTSHAHSLSFSVAHGQEKSHLCPIKTSRSPTKLIACVSVCV